MLSKIIISILSLSFLAILSVVTAIRSSSVNEKSSSSLQKPLLNRDSDHQLNESQDHVYIDVGKNSNYEDGVTTLSDHDDLDSASNRGEQSEPQNKNGDNNNVNVPKTYPHKMSKLTNLLKKSIANISKTIPLKNIPTINQINDNLIQNFNLDHNNRPGPPGSTSGPNYYLDPIRENFKSFESYLDKSGISSFVDGSRRMKEWYNPLTYLEPVSPAYSEDMEGSDKEDLDLDEDLNLGGKNTENVYDDENDVNVLSDSLSNADSDGSMLNGFVKVDGKSKVLDIGNNIREGVQIAPTMTTTSTDLSTAAASSSTSSIDHSNVNDPNNSNAYIRVNEGSFFAHYAPADPAERDRLRRQRRVGERKTTRNLRALIRAMSLAGLILGAKEGGEFVGGKIGEIMYDNGGDGGKHKHHDQIGHHLAVTDKNSIDSNGDKKSDSSGSSQSKSSKADGSEPDSKSLKHERHVIDHFFKKDIDRITHDMYPIDSKTASGKTLPYNSALDLYAQLNPVSDSESQDQNLAQKMKELHINPLSHDWSKYGSE